VTVQQEATQGVILTGVAAAKVSSLLAQEGRDDLRLRIAVQPGGCSGLRYQLYFDEREIDGDVVSAFGGVQVVTDKMSAPYLMGATIDFVDTIEKQGFTIDNPNDLGDVATKIGVELRNQYVLGYRPAKVVRDGKWRKIKVKLLPPKGLPPLRVYARTGYYAPQ